MIFSRTLARRRISAGIRPGWLAAWVPVLGDTSVIIGLLVALTGPLGMAAADSGVTSNTAVALFLFIFYFIPFQTIVILSSIWATRSRWRDKADR